MALSKIAVIAPGFTQPSPAQQILDRFLAGYPANGAFRTRAANAITLFAPGASPDTLAPRIKDLGLLQSGNLEDALAGAEAALIAWPGPGHAVEPGLVETILAQLKPGARCFVHGLLAADREAAAHADDLARSRRIQLTAATVLPCTPRLPEAHLKRGSTASDSLIVVQGDDHEATLHGVEGLHSDLERGGTIFDLPLEIRKYSGAAVWTAGDRGEWSRELLGAALSRSNNPQGDPMTDGRTQDLLGLGLVPRLARNPRAWITRHGDGSRSAILALDGVVTDINIAVRPRSGPVVSAQLYRPPAPNQAAFHHLTAVIEDFFNGAVPPWSGHRGIAVATWHAALVAR